MSEKSLQKIKKGLLGITNAGHEALAKFDSEYLDKINEFYIEYTIQREGASLPRKTKELIIMTVCSALAHFRGTRIHMKRALLSGATPREVLEALQTAAIPGGLPIVWTGAEILAEELKGLNRSFE